MREMQKLGQRSLTIPTCFSLTDKSEECETFAIQRFSSIDELGMSNVQIVSREITLVGDDKIHIFTENPSEKKWDYVASVKASEDR